MFFVIVVMLVIMLVVIIGMVFVVIFAFRMFFVIVVMLVIFVLFMPVLFGHQARVGGCHSTACAVVRYKQRHRAFQLFYRGLDRRQILVRSRFVFKPHDVIAGRFELHDNGVAF